MTTLLGSEAFPIYDPAGSSAAAKNRSVTLDVLRDHWRKISYPSKGNVTCNSDGSVSITPLAPFGVDITSGNLGSVDYDNVTPMLKIRRGNNRFTPNLELYGAAVGGNIFELKWASHHGGTYPRVYFNDSLQGFMQSSLTVSGDQVVNAPTDPRGNNGAILPPTDLNVMLGLRQDVQHGLCIRNANESTYPSATQVPLFFKTFLDSADGATAYPTNAQGHVPLAVFGNGVIKFGSGVTEANLQTGMDTTLARKGAGHLGTNGGFQIGGWTAANGEIANSTATLWWDAATNTLKLRGKNAGGTVFNADVAVAA